MVDEEDRVHVAHRGTPHPILVFDRDGQCAGHWGEGQIGEPHYIIRAADGGILVADPTRTRSCASTPRSPCAGTRTPALADVGRAVQSSNRRGDGPGRRDLRCRRVRQLQRSPLHRRRYPGSYLGRTRRAPGAFTTPHAIWIDRFGKVLVADRENNRVQVFDRQGAWMAEWRDFYHPMKIWVDDRDLVFVTDQIPRISLLTPDGRLVGRCRGAVNGAHGICGDSQGNIFLAELPPQDVTKLERIE